MTQMKRNIAYSNYPYTILLINKKAPQTIHL